MTYTLRELRVAAAAREIRDGDKVFVGMRLALLGFAVAKEIHALRLSGSLKSATGQRRRCGHRDDGEALHY